MSARTAMVDNLVTISNGQAVTNTLVIAANTVNEHKAVIQLVRTYLADLEEFGRVTFEMAPFETAGGTQQREIAILNEQQSTLILTLMRNSEIVVRFKVRLVKEFWELAKRPIPQTLPEALRLAADLAEQKALAEQQRDEAIATKAMIGNKREATAMNTASQAIKKAAKLEIELDRSKEYATVKRMEMLYHGQKFNWRMLKSAAAEMDIPPIDVFDANYGTVNGYHADVWREAYALEIEPGRQSVPGHSATLLPGAQ